MPTVYWDSFSWCRHEGYTNTNSIMKMDFYHKMNMGSYDLEIVKDSFTCGVDMRDIQWIWKIKIILLIFWIIMIVLITAIILKLYMEGNNWFGAASTCTNTQNI